MILVAGATGLLGYEICQRLIERGEQVKALVRATSSREKVEGLRSLGCEVCPGDLKEPDSLIAACRGGVDTVISTASSTFSQQAGDDIASVDATGQLSLVESAKAANIERFVLASFRRTPDISFPLAEAKAQAEEAITGLNFTVIQASFFMEVWLSPALGFDYPNATAHIYGPGIAPTSWVSFRDVAEMCAVAVRHSEAQRRIIEFGGPEAVSPLDVVARFESIGGRKFKVEHVPEKAIRLQFEETADPLQKSFAALQLGYISGDAMDMTTVGRKFGLRLTSIDEYARGVLGLAATA